MSDQLQFDWAWLEPFDAEAEEGQTFAALTLRIGGRVATELEDLASQTLRDNVQVSAYPLALFLATNWWRLRWEPEPRQAGPEWRLRHNLLGAGEGYAWPNITFASDGEAIHAQVHAGAPSATSPVRYVADFCHSIPAADFEIATREFIEGVTGRLEALHHTGSELAEIWSQVRTEYADPEASRWRQLEALAGYDPDEAPEAFVETLLGESGDVGWSAIQELAASSRERTREDLYALREAVRKHGIAWRVADFEHLRERAREAVRDRTRFPWARAAEAARRARELWGLDGEAVSNDTLTELMELPRGRLGSDAETTDAPYSASAWPEKGEGARLVFNRRRTTSRRFAACRLLGDRLYERDESRLSAATDAYTSRQKFQRAFAQELLCPFKALMDFLRSLTPTEDDIEEAASYFDVSPLLVRTELVNYHILSRDAFDDQLGRHVETQYPIECKE